jgi:hypothetical protein
MRCDLVPKKIEQWQWPDKNCWRTARRPDKLIKFHNIASRAAFTDPAAPVVVQRAPRQIAQFTNLASRNKTGSQQTMLQ